LWDVRPWTLESILWFDSIKLTGVVYTNWADYPENYKETLREDLSNLK
jgi:hypothetical protein